MVIENLFLILGADCKIGLIIADEGRYGAYKKGWLRIHSTTLLSVLNLPVLLLHSQNTLVL